MKGYLTAEKSTPCLLKIKHPTLDVKNELEESCFYGNTWLKAHLFDWAF
jgi:hypothetical protein